METSTIGPMLKKKNPDIFIKDEGYADVILHNNLKAMEWCHFHGYKNSLDTFGKTWAGQLVWYPGMKRGMYKFALYPFALGKMSLNSFIKKVKAAGFTVQSEF